jgi:tRNA pseudouridine13 synthase
MTIKREYDDFVVEEVLSDAIRARVGSAGTHALYRLHKRGLATPEAVGFVAKKLRLPPTAVSFAGLKDKHAATSQYITADLAGAAPARALAGEGWRIEHVGFVDAPIVSSDIACNRFRITVRALTHRTAADMDEAAEMLAAPAARGTPMTGSEGTAANAAAMAPAPGAAIRRRGAGRAAGGAGAVRIVNYYGGQRFGSARHGQGFPARLLIAGRFEDALRLLIATPTRHDKIRMKEFKRTLAQLWGKWAEALRRLPRCPERAAVERLAARPADFRAAFEGLPYFTQFMNVEAYQSYLWNRVAAGLIEEQCMDRGSVLGVNEEYGELLFPVAGAIPDDLAGFDLPLLGHNSELVEPWAKAAAAVLKAEGITTADLRIPGLRRPFFAQSPRKLFVTAGRFAISPPKPDEYSGVAQRLRRTVEFDLPRGAYATVVLRALGQ